ncbi:gp436 family protein [Acinetobacter gyllenbergii]|uniref:gp436 family protein n=1 Tax=Acinetobacter gyllenbergii TaxID=134534 RepID=UPI003AF805E4
MYVTADAMRERFGDQELIELTDNREPYQYAINYDKLNAALDEANSEIDGYVQVRYKLPLPIIPPYLVAIGCHIARYHLCTMVVTENDPIKIRYNDAVKTLRAISKGDVALGGTPAGESAPLETSTNNVMLVVGRRDFGGGGW